MFKCLFKSAVSILGVMAITGTSYAATLNNGDFETGDFSGWTVSDTVNGGSVFQNIGLFDVNQNSITSSAATFNIGQLDHSGVDGGIVLSQGFSVTTAGTYNFSVDVAIRETPNLGSNADGGTFELLISGVSLDIFASGSIASNAIENATLSGSMDLGIGFFSFDIRITRSFLFGSATPLQFVDDATIDGPEEPGLVPLPASLPLLLGGIAVIGFLRQRRAKG